MHNVYGGMFSVSKRYDSGRVWNSRNKPRTVAPLVGAQPLVHNSWRRKRTSLGYSLTMCQQNTDKETRSVSRLRAKLTSVTRKGGIKSKGAEEDKYSVARDETNRKSRRRLPPRLRERGFFFFALLNYPTDNYF